jgi:hypothetical protein
MENMVIASLRTLLARDLHTLEKEITLYTSEDLLWIIRGEIKNSPANLCLHLCGNLQHFIGAVLGNSGYVRNRDLEFSATGLSRAHLLTEIQTTRSVVLHTLNKLPVNVLTQEYPQQVFGHPMTTLYFLIHLAGHFNYHLGQINYHRRLVSA